MRKSVTSRTFSGRSSEPSEAWWSFLNILHHHATNYPAITNSYGNHHLHHSIAWPRSPSRMTSWFEPSTPRDNLQLTSSRSRWELPPAPKWQSSKHLRLFTTLPRHRRAMTPKDWHNSFHQRLPTRLEVLRAGDFDDRDQYGQRRRLGGGSMLCYQVSFTHWRSFISCCKEPQTLKLRADN